MSLEDSPQSPYYCLHDISKICDSCKEECQIEIVVENNNGMESGHQPGKSDSVTTHKRYVK